MRYDFHKMSADSFELMVRSLNERIFERKIIYLELEIMLRYCVVRNKEKLWVEMYLRLERETFDKSSQIRNRIINDMIETKSNASKGQEEGAFGVIV